MDEICRDGIGASTTTRRSCTPAIQWLHAVPKAGRPCLGHVLLFSSAPQADLADWYAQLLAESIGKRKSRAGEDVFVGPTPIRAVGVTDQHSQVQLYVEGPKDKWFTLLSVDQPDHAVEIPHAYSDREGVAYLGGRTLRELFQAERDGTRIALTEANRPNVTLSLEKVDAHALGQLIYMFELSVALMGEHYDVDAFDQPGVEAGKVAAYALMGRAGFEARRAEIEASTPKNPRVI